MRAIILVIFMILLLGYFVYAVLSNKEKYEDVPNDWDWDW